MRVAVLDDYHRIAHTLADWSSLGVEVAFFDKPLAREELPKVLADFDTLVLMRERTAFPREVLEQLPNLKLVITTGMRNDSLDVECLSSRGVRVCGTGIPGYGRSDALGAANAPEPRGLPSTIEIAWALIFALFKRVASEDRAIRAGIWQQGLPANLAGATLGLAGLGRLGAKMVEPARVFGMDVIAWSENLTPERAEEAGALYVSKQELLAGSDVLSIHLVLSERTRGLIGAAELAEMKPTAFLVNTSRGPIVDEAALAGALRERRIAGAGLDVYAVEPLPPDSDLLTLDNAVLTPHFGYVSVEGLTEMYVQVVEDIAAYLRGQPIRVID
ncbi:MAG TPA: D-2-hydroxyacid dehydrogenase family protein [Solirubrobacteraceae bacterium]|jgi:phosphoglycerate dehydrogenase-like enzyme|nr:D-2-hydroxyacid dehydrogenase family protein [Solirubrobacteraceae bacterium]